MKSRALHLTMNSADIDSAKDSRHDSIWVASKM